MGPTKPQLGRAVTHPGPLGPARLSLLACFYVGFDKGLLAESPESQSKFLLKLKPDFP